MTDVISILKNGGIGVLPTDTIYGLVGSALDPRVVERIFLIKKRNPDKPLVVLISNVDNLNLFGVNMTDNNIVPWGKPLGTIVASLARYWKSKNFSNTLSSLANKKFLDTVWPGPVSVILPCANEAFSYLHRKTNSIAFRLPAFDAFRRLIEQTGPLVAPSANPEGRSPATTIREAKAYFEDTVDFYEDGGSLEGRPSSLVDLTGLSPRIIRKGIMTIAFRE